MTREIYLNHRNNRNTGDIMYEYYKEGFDIKKHAPFLHLQVFIEYINIWNLATVFLPSVLSYFDCKFEVQKLSDKNGQIIKFI